MRRTSFPMLVFTALVAAGCADPSAAPAPEGPLGQGDALRPGNATAPAGTLVQHDVDFDGLVAPSVCVPVPTMGYCTGPGVSREDWTLIEQSGATWWQLNLTLHWNATTALTASMAYVAQPYRSCGAGCIAGYDGRGLRVAGASPLHLDARLEVPEDAEGLWLSVDARQGLPLGGHYQAAQAFHLVGLAAAAT